MSNFAAIFALVCLLAPLPTTRANPGDEVVVVYNRNMADSKAVAEHYARLRQIPQQRLIGLDLPVEERISRRDFERRLQEPLLKHLRDSALFVYAPNVRKRPDSSSGPVGQMPVEAKIRYATLCYGVPLKILNDPKLREQGIETLRPELKRNDAAVDSELCLLPVLSPKPPVYGVVPNRLFGSTNAANLHPTNGILIVARLDGPTPEIARSLVDKAIEAERDGLWGRAYFDARGLTNSHYSVGDDWIRGGAQLTRRLGFETVLDNSPATFPAGFPMSHIAIYAGWYDAAVSGPFTRSNVEFMPGAFAYHLHSFSAQTIRSATANWVGPLLEKGATATMGCVEEPYLEGTPDILTFLARLIFFGFSFGEAAYASQGSLSWQTTVVGDPLYRPFGRKPLDQHSDLHARNSKLIEWSHLRAVNLNIATGLQSEKLIEYLESIPETPASAVLLEKLADLNLMRLRYNDAIKHYRLALEQSPSPQQELRLRLSLARTLEMVTQHDDLYAVYQQFAARFPDYPDLLNIYRRLTSLAEELGKAEDKDFYAREVDRLSAATGPQNQ
jgi:uncharacterized protein (TIGR03790 family)